MSNCNRIKRRYEDSAPALKPAELARVNRWAPYASLKIVCSGAAPHDRNKANKEKSTNQGILRTAFGINGLFLISQLLL